MFWYSIVLAVAAGLFGYVLSWELSVRGVKVGVSGTIVVLCVVFFTLAAIVGVLGRRLRAGSKQVA